MQRTVLSTARGSRQASRCHCLQSPASALSALAITSTSTAPSLTSTNASSNSLSSIRTFSSTPLTLARPHNTRVNHEHAEIPPYPYGPSRTYKQSNFGLYSSLQIRFGNKVSAEYKNKSRRTWKPNVHHKKLWSVGLNRWIRTKVATRTLRSIDKVGGLDNYLLGGKAKRVKDLGMGGWRLRWMLLGSEWGKQWMKSERARLGLPAVPESEVLAELLLGEKQGAGVATAVEVEEVLADDAVVSLDEESDLDRTEWVDEDVKRADAGSGSVPDAPAPRDGKTAV